MAKRKPIQTIKSAVSKLIAEAKSGNLKRKTVQFGCGDGLTVAVNNGTGKAVWLARCAGKSYVLGDFTRMEYKTASARVAKLKATHEEEKADPGLPANPTVAEYFPVYLEFWILQHKEGSARQSNFKSLMRTTLYPLHDIKLNELTRRIIIEKIRAIPQTPNNKHNAVGLLNQMLRYAYNSGVIDSNPISDLLNTRESPFPLKAVTHHASVHYSEFIKKVVQPLNDVPEFLRAFYLMSFLTGFRFGEVRLLRWSWLDIKEMAFMIPPTAKGSNKSKHVLVKPLTPPMKDLLQYLYDCNEIQSDFVFQSPVKSAPTCISPYSIREPWRQYVKSEVSDFHGVRSTIRSWIKEQRAPDPHTGYMKPVFSFEAAEGALTHDTRDSLEKSYDNSERIEPVREVLIAWNNWLLERLPDEFMDILHEGQNMSLDWNKGTFLNQIHVES